MVIIKVVTMTICGNNNDTADTDDNRNDNGNNKGSNNDDMW